MKQIILIVLALLCLQSFGCKCKHQGNLDSLRAKSYRYADIVFYGKLIEIDTISFTFKYRIKELFKGDTKDSTITGKYFNSCSSFPQRQGNWIVYATYESNDTINISQCNASRNENFPYCPNCPFIPHPPPPGATKQQLKEIENYYNTLESRAIEEFFNELDILRKWSTIN